LVRPEATHRLINLLIAQPHRSKGHQLDEITVVLMAANGGRSSQDARDLLDQIERVAAKQPPSKYRGFPDRVDTKLDTADSEEVVRNRPGLANVPVGVKR
jgi:hypothetical protein